MYVSRVCCTRACIYNISKTPLVLLSFLLLLRFFETDNKPLVVLRIDIAARPPIDIPSNDPTRSILDSMGKLTSLVGENESNVENNNLSLENYYFGGIKKKKNKIVLSSRNTMTTQTINK